jgi:hypothetical protein
VGNLGVCVDQIIASGQSESHQEATQRLLDELGMQSNELFRSQDEVINKALLKREQDIAYLKKYSWWNHAQSTANTNLLK